MKIIHLSDLHLKPGKCARSNRRFNQLTDRLNSSDYDGSEIIIITGDLIENAEKRGAMEHARKMLGSLQPKFKTILICAGNHDYGNFWGGRPIHMKPFFDHFSEFLSSNIPPAEGDPGCDERAYNSPFPVVNEMGEFLFIGLDTMEGEFSDEIGEDERDWDWGAEGELGCRQQKALKALLGKEAFRDKKLVIYLHHHPYVNRHILNRFRDADDFNKAVADRDALLLFGHNHKFENMADEARDHHVAMALEGGSIKSSGNIRFRIIDFSGAVPVADDVELTVPKSWWNIFSC